MELLGQGLHFTAPQAAPQAAPAPPSLRRQSRTPEIQEGTEEGTPEAKKPKRAHGPDAREQQSGVVPMDQGRPEVHDGLAVGNMSAMLLALVRWTQQSPGCDSLSVNKWVFQNPEHQADLNALLNHPKMHESIDAMLSTPVMRVAASSEFADIEARTRGWQGFDIKGLRQAATSSEPSLITCASLNLNAERWPEAFAKKLGGGYTRPMTGRADAATLVIPVCDSSCFFRDARGLVVFKYNLQVSGHNVSVVLTHVPLSYKEPFTLTQLVTEHAVTGGLTPLTGAEYKHCEFHSFKVEGGTESLRPIQGIEQGPAQIIALQGKSHLQINKSTPLNLACRSVAVMHFRGMQPPPPPAYQMFERGPDGKVRFNNLAEVQVDGRTVFATMTTFNDTTDAGS